MLRDRWKFNKNIARRFMLFGIVIVAVTWITAISDIKQKVGIELDGVKTNNQNLTLVLEEHVSVVLSQIESQLLSVRRNHEYGINNNEMQLILETTVSSRPDLFNLISIIDSDGNVRLTNQRHFTSTNSGDRDFFIYHKNNIDPSIKIGKPLLGRVTGKWYIPVSLLLRNKNGDFDGVLLVSLNPDYFSMIFRKLKLGEKSLITRNSNYVEI